jgi:hypothetical protein
MADEKPAAPAAPAAAPKVDTRAAAFEANVAKARAMAQGVTNARPNVPQVPEVRADQQPEDAEGGAPSVVDDVDDTEVGETAPPITPTGAGAKALGLLTAGDLAGAIKELGGDPALADTSDIRFAALRSKETKAKQAEAARLKAHERAVGELTKMSQAAQTQLNEFHRENNFVNGVRKACAEKNWVGVAKGLEAFTKMTIAELTQKLASGKSGLTPEDKRLEEDRAKLARERQEFEASKAKPNVEAQRATALQRVSEQLKEHPFLKVTKGFEARAKSRLEKTFAAWEKTWDGAKFTKTPAQCAAELQQELLDDMKANGIAVPKTKTAATKPTRTTPPKAENQARNGGVIDKNSTFENRVAMAKRLSSLGTRN